MPLTISPDFSFLPCCAAVNACYQFGMYSSTTFVCTSPAVVHTRTTQNLGLKPSRRSRSLENYITAVLLSHEAATWKQHLSYENTQNKTTGLLLVVAEIRLLSLSDFCKYTKMWVYIQLICLWVQTPNQIPKALYYLIKLFSGFSFLPPQSLNQKLKSNHTSLGRHAAVPGGEGQALRPLQPLFSLQWLFIFPLPWTFSSWFSEQPQLHYPISRDYYFKDQKCFFY